jgi:hypothetical protein
MKEKKEKNVETRRSLDLSMINQGSILSTKIP